MNKVAVRIIFKSLLQQTYFKLMSHKNETFGARTVLLHNK